MADYLDWEHHLALPSDFLDFLQDAGFDIHNPEIIKVATISAIYPNLSSKEKDLTVRLLRQQKELRHRPDLHEKSAGASDEAVAEYMSTISEILRYSKRRQRRFGLSVFIIVTLGLFLFLIDNYASFVISAMAVVKFLNQLITFGMWDSVISSAYAQSGNPNMAEAAKTAVLPFVVYLIYVLFTIAYMISAFVAFLRAPNPKAQTSAYDTFKSLTGFFIGSVTGKVV